MSQTIICGSGMMWFRVFFVVVKIEIDSAVQGIQVHVYVAGYSAWPKNGKQWTNQYVQYQTNSKFNGSLSLLNMKCSLVGQASHLFFTFPPKTSLINCGFSKAFLTHTTGFLSVKQSIPCLFLRCCRQNSLGREIN